MAVTIMAVTFMAVTPMTLSGTHGLTPTGFTCVTGRAPTARA